MARSGATNDSFIVVIGAGANPSTDYFARPFVQRNYSSAIFIDLNTNPADYIDQIPDGSDVLIVRYMNKAWLQFIKNQRTRLGRISFFFDDDLLSALAWRSLPTRYAWRLAINALFLRFGLMPLVDDYFVGSQWLSDKYYNLNPTVLTPAPFEPRYTDRPLILFYHGTASHFAEKAWLVPIISEILRTNADVHFEIIGDSQIKALYRSLPRVTVVHQMDWANYQAFCIQYRRDIGLAPVLDNRFNSARSETKIFDIQRCRASGIFSNVEPFASRLQKLSGVTLVDNVPSLWIKTIQLQLEALRASI